MRQYLALITACTLSACVQQPNGSYVVTPGSISNFLNQHGSTQASGIASSGSLPSGTTEWIGQVDGGKANAELKQLSATQYHLNFSATGTGNAGQLTGAGGVDGVLNATGAEGMFAMTKSDGGDDCALIVKLTNQTMHISENFNNGLNGCMFEHGAAISFDGVLNRTQ